MRPSPAVPRAAAVLLILAALALFWLAFTQFEAGGSPPAGSPAYEGYHEGMIRDAQLSVAFGLGGCFVLLGAFACLNRARARTAPPDPQP